MKLSKEEIEKFSKMNESFNKSLEFLNAQLDGEKLDKAMKGSSKKSSSASSESEEEESPIKQNPEGSSSSEEEEPRGKMKKSQSLEDMVISDPDAQAAIDVEPFLKSLVNAIDEKLEDIRIDLFKSIKKMGKKVDRIEGLSKALAMVSRDAFEMQKSLQADVEKIGNTPIPTTSVMRKSGERFPENTNDGSLEGVQKHTILAATTELIKSGKLSAMDATLIEGRINAGAPLEPRHAVIISEMLAPKK